MNVRCVVACVNSNGDPDFYFVIVRVSTDQFNDGDHYEAAMQAATAEGYKAKLVYDEFDNAGRALLPLFVWESASMIIPYAKQSHEA